MTDEQRARANECARENYMWKKEQHKCVRCGKQDAYTISGRSLCYECAEKKRLWEKTNHEKNSCKKTAYRNKKYKECVENGICVRCHKRPADSGYKSCLRCRTQNRIYNNNKNRERGMLPKLLFDGVNYCRTCGAKITSENKVDGKKLCKSCYQKAVENLKKATEIRMSKEPNDFDKGNDLFWRRIMCRKSKANKE